VASTLTSHHVDTWDTLDRRSQRLGRAEQPLSRLEVSLLAEPHHGGPRGGAEGARSGAGGGRRAVVAALPLGEGEELVLAQVLGAVEHDAGALRGVAVLVRVGGDGGHAGQGEVEVGNVAAQRAREREDEAAQAAVDVQADVVLERDL
jgi:hypothetical protein